MLAVACLCHAQEITTAELRADVSFLAGDLLEGRAPGTRGGDLATAYLAAQLAHAGARPAGANGSWLQPVPLVGVSTRPDSFVQSGEMRLRWLDDFAGHAQNQQQESPFDGQAVFVGHGIRAPEFGWDDYKGLDVKGKTVVLITNEPPSDRPDFFEGRALTYYGRWTYKFEEAYRQGAAAALIIHADETAGYGWDVVRNSWGREDAQPRGASGLRFAGWITREAGARMLAQSGHDLDELVARAGKRGFRPVALAARASGQIRSVLRPFTASNVVGRMEGSDPAATGEAVVFTAHWDHLGVAESGDGDRIFNGAVDNATGCAMVAAIARAWASLAVGPRRSAVFLFTTAEEAGLRGAAHYVANPVVPLDKTALVLNFDSFLPVGVTRDVVIAGAERTPFLERIEAIARLHAFTVRPDPRPESGGFFRSDHFPFARAGVVALSVKGGTQFHAQAEEHARIVKSYRDAQYHKPGDEYTDDWVFSGMQQAARFGLALGVEAANVEEKPAWEPTATARGPASGRGKQGTSRPRSPRPN